MTARTPLAAAALLLAAPLLAPAAAPVPAARGGEGGPPVVFQVAPLDTLLDNIKAAAKAFGGEMAAGEVTRGIEGKLGPKGFAGIDTKKPMAAFLYVPETFGLAGKKPNEVNPAEVLGKFRGALVIPVTKPDEFKDFIARLSDGKVKLDPVAGKEGLYKLDNPQEPAPFPIRVRFHADHAYVGLNFADDDLEAKALPAVETLVNPKETAALAVRAYPDRYPPGLMKEAMDSVDAAIGDLKNQLGKQNALGVAERALASYIKLVRRYSDQLMKESSEAGYRLTLDGKEALLGFEMYIVPKKGTSLAADIAARKPSTNRFAGLVTAESAVGFTGQLPLFSQEVRDILTDLIAEGQKQAKDKAPPQAQPVLEALLAGLGKTVKTGEFDLAGAVTGPDKDGHFTAVAAIAFEDAPDLEKALRDAAKDAPGEVKNAIQFDAEKAGGVSIHKITPPQDPPAAVGKIFGATTVYVAFGKHGIYAAVGTGALDALKSALAAKPAPARALDVTVNPKRLQKMVAAGDGEEAGKRFAELIGTEDKARSVLFASLEGGDALRVKFGMSLTFLPRATMGARAVPVPDAPPVAVPVKDAR